MERDLGLEFYLSARLADGLLAGGEMGGTRLPSSNIGRLTF
jgi:hypothetical protein